MSCVIQKIFNGDIRVFNKFLIKKYSFFEISLQSPNFIRNTLVKLINCIIHHGTVSGIGFWAGMSGESEVYGNIVYDNGYTGPDRGHGHSIYTQGNEFDGKFVRVSIRGAADNDKLVAGLKTALDESKWR